MSVRLRSLMEARQRTVAAARAITEVAERDGNRALSDEEQRGFDTAIVDQERLRLQIEGEQRLATVEGELAARSGTLLNGTTPGSGHGGAAATEVRTIGTGRYGVRLDDLEDADSQQLQRRSTPEYRAAFNHFVRTGERRSLDATGGPSGGYTVVPVQMVQGLLQALDDGVFIRAKSSVFSVPNATSLGKVSLDADPADAAWTSELATGDEDSTMAFGKRELTPHPVAKRIKLSNKLLRISAMDVEGIARARLAYKFGITEEKAFLTGSGVQQPLGLFTASADGVPTSRDYSTGNTTTAITFDGLIGARYNTKAPYQKEWLFSRTAMAQIAKIRDDSGAGAGTGGYIWQPSQQVGAPDRLHGLPINVSEYVPATFTTGLYVGMIGDFSHYWIADALDMQVQRLVELYALTNQTALIMRKETDGMPVLAEAFTRIKLA